MHAHIIYGMLRSLQQILHMAGTPSMVWIALRHEWRSCSIQLCNSGQCQEVASPYNVDHWHCCCNTAYVQHAVQWSNTVTTSSSAASRITVVPLMCCLWQMNFGYKFRTMLATSGMTFSVSVYPPLDISAASDLLGACSVEN